MSINTLVQEKILVWLRRVTLAERSRKTSKELAETTKIGLRTVQCIIKTRKDSGELLSSRKKSGGKEIQNDSGWQSLKYFVKLNHRKRE